MQARPDLHSNHRRDLALLCPLCSSARVVELVDTAIVILVGESEPYSDHPMTKQLPPCKRFVGSTPTSRFNTLAGNRLFGPLSAYPRRWVTSILPWRPTVLPAFLLSLLQPQSQPQPQ